MKNAHSICQLEFLLLIEIFQRATDDLLHVLGIHSIVEREADKAVGLGGGVAVFTIETTELESGWGGMERYIVEDAEDVVVLHVLDEVLTGVKVLEFHVEHVGVVLTLGWDVWELYEAFSFEWLESVVVGIPSGETVIVDLIGSLELPPEVGGIEVGRKP